MKKQTREKVNQKTQQLTDDQTSQARGGFGAQFTKDGLEELHRGKIDEARELFDKANRCIGAQGRRASYS